MPNMQQIAALAHEMRHALIIEIKRLAGTGHPADLKVANLLAKASLEASDNTLARLHELIVKHPTRAGALDELVGATENIGSLPYTNPVAGIFPPSD